MADFLNEELKKILDQSQANACQNLEKIYAFLKVFSEGLKEINEILDKK